MNKFITLSSFLVCSPSFAQNNNNETPRSNYYMTEMTCGTADFCVAEMYEGNALIAKIESYDTVIHPTSQTALQENLIYFVDGTVASTYILCLTNGRCFLSTNKAEADYAFKNDQFIYFNTRQKRNWGQIITKGIELTSKVVDKAGRSIVNGGTATKDFVQKSWDKSPEGFKSGVIDGARTTEYGRMGIPQITDIKAVQEFQVAASKAIYNIIEQTVKNNATLGGRLDTRTYHEGRDTIGNMSNRIGNGGKIVSGKGKSHGNWAR
ncbi:hypothetical protein GCL60_02655 [Silvanigrella paludirubra]|uniref:Uncharacterized protein n=1 Tax=Silvanigrella paludirubra TaxID=2499159 RepID=A0A6N6VZS0_9BACT|nr:hypothetical protein [Silvanigrella paludirubra]KAB8040846.1 hypothetical protein GCL60_02655 [Silvanigrella paludirubra]